jgi:hypothetical protein
MYKSIIFVDFENLQKINDEIISSETKLIVMVGLDQDDKAFDFAKNLFKNLASIELIKVNGRGHNALDIFIAFYTGLYFDSIKQSDIIICSNDSGYDQLIKHLDNHGISIKRVEYNEVKNKEKKVEVKKIEKPKKKNEEKGVVGKKINSVGNAQMIIDYLKNQTQKQKEARPKKLTTLEKYLCTHFSKNASMDIIKQAIELMIKNRKISVSNNKIDYNI